MIISLLVLSFSALLLMCGIIVGNVVLTRYLIIKSSNDAISENIDSKFTDIGKRIQETFEDYIGKNYYTFLLVMHKIISTSLQYDNSVFDYNTVKTFPFLGNTNYISIN